MARRPRQPKIRQLSAQDHFGKKLVLNQWLLSRFGIDPLQEYRDSGARVRPMSVLAKSLRHAPAGLDATRQHHYLHTLLGQWQPSWRYSEEQLKRFDAHIVAHTDALNRLRPRQPVQWKYFQWLSLLFVEIYLHEYFEDRHGLLDSLNKHVERFNKHWNGRGWQTGITPYELDELNKLCLQNATGSGKTLLMHTNIRQFRHYAAAAGRAKDFGQIILVTPNERLTEQHQRELAESDLKSERLAQDAGDLLSGERKAMSRIAVTEITKLGLGQGKKTMAVESFGYANLLLDHGRLPRLLRAGNWYELRIPPALWELETSNFRLWQQIALELLSLLADRVFNYHKRAYLEPRLELVKLSKADGNLPNDPEYRLIVDGTESALIDDIRELKKTFDIDKGGHYDSGRESVAGTHLSIHLYSPLLTVRNNRIKIEPVALNDSESQFVVDLKGWLERNQARLEASGEQLYLLRNLRATRRRLFRGRRFLTGFHSLACPRRQTTDRIRRPARLAARRPRQRQD